MKSKISIMVIVIIALAGLQNCVKTVDGVTLPYEEKLVISGLLEPESDSVKITIEKTLPALTLYSKSLASLPNAEAYIECNGEKTLLEVDSIGKSSIYYYKAKLKVIPGFEYHLFVKWKNLTASASTKIPKLDGDSITKYSAKKITRSTGDYTTFHINYDVDIFTPNNSLYKFNLVDTTYKSVYYKITNYVRPINAIKNSINNIKYTFYKDSYYLNDQNLLFILIEYDYQYLKYLETMNLGRLSEDPFSTSGQNIKGNVIGDGIGYLYSINRYYYDRQNNKLIDTDIRFTKNDYNYY